MAQDTRRRRVGAELQRLLNELLRTHVKDPRLEDVTVNEVEMSGDLSVARIYYTTLDPDAADEDVRVGFQKAGGFLRGRISQALRLRRAPELHFIRDESARRGAELTRLIDRVRAAETRDAPGAGESTDRDAPEDGGPRPGRDADEQ